MKTIPPLDAGAAEDASRILLSGSKRLPKLFGGEYTYRASASNDNFLATYSCRMDHGIFVMTRVPPGQR